MSKSDKKEEEKLVSKEQEQKTPDKETAEDKLKSYKGGILISGHHGLLNGLYEPLLELIRPSMIIVSRSENKVSPSNSIVWK